MTSRNKNKEVRLETRMERRLQNRLSRIAGQVQAVKRMLSNHRSCEEVLIQAAAVKSATSQFIAELFAGHTKTCVLDNIRKGRAEWQIQRLRAALNQVLRRV